MFKNILIGLFLISTAIFGYLYETEKKKNIDLDINNSKIQRELAFNDSLSKGKDVIILELDSAYKASEEEKANVK